MDDPDLQALDDEFNARDSTMHATVYVARRAEILARPPQTRESAAAPVVATATPAPAAAQDEFESDRTPATRGFLMLVLGPLVKSIAHTMRADDAKLRADLEERIKALEARPAALAYGGTWNQGQQSTRGIFYTDKGSVWFCRETTRDRPGASGCFQLAVKAGRDAR
jgi:hypothetical protein